MSKPSSEEPLIKPIALYIIVLFLGYPEKHHYSAYFCNANLQPSNKNQKLLLIWLLI